MDEALAYAGTEFPGQESGRSPKRRRVHAFSSDDQEAKDHARAESHTSVASAPKGPSDTESGSPADVTRMSSGRQLDGAGEHGGAGPDTAAAESQESAGGRHPGTSASPVETMRKWQQWVLMPGKHVPPRDNQAPFRCTRHLRAGLYGLHTRTSSSALEERIMRRTLGKLQSPLDDTIFAEWDGEKALKGERRPYQEQQQDKASVNFIIS